MALDFDISANGLRETNQSWGLTTGPFTFACWLDSDDGAAVSKNILILDTSPGVSFYRTDTNHIAFFDGGAVRAFDTLIVSNQSYHVAISRDASSVLRGWVDGVQESTTHSSITVSLPENTNHTIGANNSGASGSRAGLGELAVWNVALNTNDMASLAAGHSPKTVRPQSLVRYARMRNTNDLADGVVSRAWTLIGSPTLDPHPRIIYPFEGNQAYTAPVPATNVAMVGMA